MEKQFDVLCVGAAVIDIPLQPVSKNIFDVESYPLQQISMTIGGDAINESTVISRLGHKTALATMVGDDAAGQYIIQHCQREGICVEGIRTKENIDTSTPTGKLMLTMIGAINEFERTNLLERQREGIAIAKAEGKYKGRKEVKVDNFEEHYHRYKNRELNKSQLAKELDVSRPTLDKLIKEYEEGR